MINAVATRFHRIHALFNTEGIYMDPAVYADEGRTLPTWHMHGSTVHAKVASPLISNRHKGPPQEWFCLCGVVPFVFGF